MLVYSREHNAWWGPNHCGYTTNIDDAGRYTEAEADKIVASACRGRGGHGDEGPPEFKMDAPEIRHVLGEGYLVGIGNGQLIGLNPTPEMKAGFVSLNMPPTAASESDRRLRRLVLEDME